MISGGSSKYCKFLLIMMHYPIVAEKDGVKIAPEHMEKEKFYHCIFNDNVLLIFKDEQEFLHCYEIDDKELVGKIKNSSENGPLEKIFEDYIERENLKTLNKSELPK